MEMNLPLINIFENAYEVWETRNPTLDEVKKYYEKTGEILDSINVRLKVRLTNHFDAAKYILEVGIDNGLEWYIDRYLDETPKFQAIFDTMSSNRPESIKVYQEQYFCCDLEQVSVDINDFGNKLQENQYLFHGGFCKFGPGSTVITERPLSTSFCPQIALRSAEWLGKAYETGEIHILVFRVSNPLTKAYVFSNKGDFGNEKEVLFSSGAKLEIKNKTLIRNDYRVYKIDVNDRELIKLVPAYVLEIDIT